MERLEEIGALFEEAEAALAEIRVSYGDAVKKRKVSAHLKVRIKQLLESLRSVLDYLGLEVHERYCAALSKRRIDVYFPIVRLSAGEQDFTNLMRGRFPALLITRPDVYVYLEGI